MKAKTFIIGNIRWENVGECAQPVSMRGNNVTRRVAVLRRRTREREDEKLNYTNGVTTMRTSD